MDKTFAIVITGAVTSGKTTLAEKVSTHTKFPLLNETTVGNYYKILDSIDTRTYPRAIYDHCYIHKKAMIFESLYDRFLIVGLRVEESFLLKNYEKRLLADSRGDFSKINPISQQEEIMKQLKDLKPLLKNRRTKILIENISSISDYSKVEKHIYQVLEVRNHQV